MARISLTEEPEIVQNLPAMFPNGLAHLATDPPASTNRGLRMSLNILQLKSQATHEEDLLYAWTFYMIAGQFVCMVLKPQQTTTNNVHLRVGPLHAVEMTSVKSVVQRQLFLGLKDVASLGENLTVPEHEEPTLVLRGIEPSSAVMSWWDKIYLEHQGPKAERGPAQYLLASNFSMKVRSKQNPFVNSMISTSEQSNPDGILVNDIFDIVPVKEQSPEEATEADSFTVIIGSAGNRHWCRIVCQKRNFSMQNALERLQKEFGYRTRRFGDWGFRYTSMGSLPNKVLARARVRPGRAVGQITELGGTCPYLVYISVLFNSNGV